MLIGERSLKDELAAGILEIVGELPRRLTAEFLRACLVFRLSPKSDEEGTMVGHFRAIRDGDRLELRNQHALETVSGSDWKPEQLVKLKIQFERVRTSNELLREFDSVPPFCPVRVQRVEQLTQGIGVDFFRDDYAEVIAKLRKEFHRDPEAEPDDPMPEPAMSSSSSAASAAAAAASSSELPEMSAADRYLHPLIKTLYMMSNYPSVEAVVNDFVSQLLRVMLDAIPNSRWLYVFPQLPLPLVFGGVSDRCATADHTIVDVGSFFRMAVFEDKSALKGQEGRINSEPQVIAEAIAAHQANMQLKSKQATRKKQRQANNASAAAASSCAPAPVPDPLLAVRVSGTSFFFYSVRVTSHLLDVMHNGVEAVESTNVLKMSGDNPGDADGLNFYTPKDRTLILQTLDQMGQIIAAAAHASQRRVSGAASPATADAAVASAPSLASHTPSATAAAAASAVSSPASKRKCTLN